MQPIAMTMLFVLLGGAFSISAYRRIRQLGIGTADREFTLADGEWWNRLRDTMVYALGQRRMPNYSLAGLGHILIFWGFLVLGLRTLMLWARGYDAHFDFWGLLAKGTLLGDGYSLTKDIFAILVMLGLAVFFYLRLVKKGRDRGDAKGNQRMTLGFEGLLILGIIGTMMIADILYDGAVLVEEARDLGLTPTFGNHPWEPAGAAMSMALSGIESATTIAVLKHAGFWAHSALVLIFLNILPFSKHFHVLTVFFNVFSRSGAPRGRLPKVDDLEGKVEREEALGINRITDLSWSQILDLYTCTECGRCSDNCPAYNTNKKLSPKHLTLALRDHLYDTEGAMFGNGDDLPGSASPGHHDAADREEIHTYPRPPADAYFRSSTPVEIVPHILDPDVIWSCTTCRACEEQCPVMISYVDKIVGMRRELVMMKAEFPPELTPAFNGMETNGNPWNISAMDRPAWAEGLDVPMLSDRPHADVLYWVGCAASYDDRAKKIARSLVQLLQHAGVDFAILGEEECCTGDPARRAGNEYLFQMLAEQNVEVLKKYDCEKKTILTACPHCFNALLNDYADFGARFRVVHHSDYLMDLVREGRLVPTKPVAGRVAFHDSCYLGRYNDIYDSPRQILNAIPGVELVEVPYWNREKGLCCGAGGARMFMEEDNDNRVNNKRALQLIDTGATTLASGCPFCSTMLGDGLKAYEKEDEIAQLDVAEMLLQSVDLGESAGGASRGGEAAEEAAQ